LKLLPFAPAYRAAGVLLHITSLVAALAIAPLQDVLNLGREARMNIPGRPDGNWSWRYTEDMLSDRDFESLRNLTKNSNRLGLVSPHTGKMLEAVSQT
jgi:4-alpha-glucanotransferase